jgi:NAD(P)-dependent dehydrogenase (short-subunit alcohol dehydrogenase family)
MKKNLLVLGARPGSIGSFVQHRAETEWDVHTVGVGVEEMLIDCSEPFSEETGRKIRDVIYDRPWHAVVCTIGTNHEAKLGNDEDPLWRVSQDFDVNVVAPLLWLEWWLGFWQKHTDEVDQMQLHFAVLSSNSAHVPRSSGLSYCTTKAALSMAIRCVARDWAKRDARISIYAYELGWVNGTPMSRSVERRLSADVPLTRAPGGRMLSREDLSRMIVSNLNFGHAINGSIIRVDAGES